MLIGLLNQKAVGKDVNVEETIGEYECSKVPQALFESTGSMRHGGKAGWLTAVLKETHLKMTVPPLPELTQWYTSCVSPTNARVIVLALNSKCRVVVLASAKGTISNVGE